MESKDTLWDQVENQSFKIRQQLYMHCGHYLDFIVPIDSNRLLSKANSKLLMINSDNYNLIKSKEVQISYGARAAAIVEGDKVFISFKNRVLVIYDTNNLTVLQ